MHPAYSVIVFTIASGAGYGLLFWYCLAVLTGQMPAERWLETSILLQALLLISAGLISSTLHLGHPERAIRAFSQWRSSWLSREGVAAMATYFPAGLLLVLAFLNIATGKALLALLAAAGALVTVYCTGMIYASLSTIRQWNMKQVPQFYLAASAATGAILLALMLALFGHTPNWTGWLVVASLLVALVLKWAYWKQIDHNQGQYTAAMATGLGEHVRQLDPPHTKPNFVMREMGYQIGRKHAGRLRHITIMFLFVVPLLLSLLALMSHWDGIFYLLATLCAVVGIVVERWLFFAQAEHVSMLFYGAERA